MVSQTDRKEIAEWLKSKDVVDYIYQMTNSTVAGEVSTIASMIAEPERWEGLPG